MSWPSSWWTPIGRSPRQPISTEAMFWRARMFWCELEDQRADVCFTPDKQNISRRNRPVPRQKRTFIQHGSNASTRRDREYASESVPIEVGRTKCSYLIGRRPSENHERDAKRSSDPVGSSRFVGARMVFWRD